MRCTQFSSCIVKKSGDNSGKRKTNSGRNGKIKSNELTACDALYPSLGKAMEGLYHSAAFIATSTFILY